MGILTAVIGSIQGAPTTTYTLLPFFSGGPESVNEGSGVMMKVGGTNVPDGTYYWTIQTNAGDFITDSGTVSVTGNTGPYLGSFTVSPTEDSTTEGVETFTVALRTGSITGPILVTSDPITINDTSFLIGGTLSINGQTRRWDTTNAAVPTYGAYTYPDETSGSVHTLTGTQYVISEGWGSTEDISVNLWFYPTANDKIIIGELGQNAENINYHYTMLEIDSSNKLKGRVWEMTSGQAVTSTGSVTLNAWNHVYFYYNSATTTFSMSLNNETVVTQSGVSRNISNSNSYWGIGLTDSQNMGSSARYQGKFDALVIDSNLAGGSTWTTTKAKYLPPLSLSFPLTGDPYLLVSNTQSDWNLGSTYTIEFWSKETNPSTSSIRTVASQGPGNGIDLGFMNGGTLFRNTQNPGILEPNPGVWSHVAFVGNSSNTYVYHNGVLQGTYTSPGALGDGSNDLNIGRRAGVNGQGFRGKLALIRISTTAKYLDNFSPSISYDAGADTKLMLGNNPLTDSTGTHPISVQGAVSTSADFPSFQSLEFNQPQGDFLNVAGGNDWNLGTTGTIEFWIKANNASSANINIPGGQWGLINQGGWYYGMPDNNSILIGLAGGHLSIAQSNVDAVEYTEPTAGVWTHLAVVYNSGTQKVYYNGVEQTKTSGNYSGNGWSNATSNLYIGRLAPNYGSHFDGKLAMVRISNTAKYLTAFTATTTYGVEGDTRLFLSKVNPTVDSNDHIITNNGVTTSTDFPA